MNAASKRLRLRFFPADTAAVDAVLAHTKHSSQSNSIRAALALYAQACSNRRMGCRIVFYRSDSGEMPDAFDSAQKGPGTEPVKRVHTEQSIEIRVTPSDFERIESILAMEAADTVSEAVRRSVRFYATAIEKCRDGWELVAISPSGDILPLQLTGAGVGSSSSGDRPVKKQESGGGLIFHLPRSLDALIQELAAREGCAPDILMADLVRTEAQTRLERLARGEVARTEVQAPRTEKIEQPAPHAMPPDAGLEEISEELHKTSAIVEDLILLVGKPQHEQGQQAQLTDLFLAADTGFELASSSTAVENSSEGVKDQIKIINSRLNNLVMLVQLQEKPKSRSRIVKTAEKPAAAAEGEAAPAGD